jgi:membrane associated rhomboid family serine protease
VPTADQLIVRPELLADLERNWPLLLDGQWWRLVTSLVVQDGGVAGAVVNLLSLALVGALAERAWGARRFTLIALVAGVGTQFWGAVVQPVGGGNSVVVFGLAAASSMAALLRGPVPARIAGALALLGGLVLLVVGDLHGGAVALGAITAVVVLVRDRRRVALVNPSSGG